MLLRVVFINAQGDKIKTQPLEDIDRKEMEEAAQRAVNRYEDYVGYEIAELSKEQYVLELEAEFRNLPKSKVKSKNKI